MTLVTAGEYPGRCPCGVVAIRLRTACSPGAFLPRSDAPTCGFCRAHDGVWISDREGVLVLPAAEATVARRFASQQIQFHFCPECDTLVYALFEQAGQEVAVARVALFPSIRSAARPAETTCFEGESIADAARRRLATWTPVARAPVAP